MNIQVCKECAHARRSYGARRIAFWCNRRGKLMMPIDVIRLPWCEFDSNRPLGLTGKFDKEKRDERKETG